MINAEEILFVVDEHNNSLDPLPRSVVHKNNLWHRTTGIWVINHDKDILCQKRSLQKDVKPGMWEAFFGGHVGAGEEYLNNAVIELGEELGVKIEKEHFIPYKILKSDKPTHREFQHIFLLLIGRTDTNFHFEKEEIDELKWLPYKNVKEIIVDNKDPQWVTKPWDSEVLEWIEKSALKNLQEVK